jgi:sterol desaturase/sphingolipid hydroxylase (fatty acid hydroxylase superfamily)
VYFPPQTRREPPIRLFRSGFLESLTHVHPVVVVAVWCPLIAWFVWAAWHRSPASGLTGGQLAEGLVAGVFVWTLVEYVLHRFVFHFSPANPAPWLRRLVFLFHGIHHVQPWVKTRLVMPPAVSIPLAVLFYLLFDQVIAGLLGAPSWLEPVFAGFLCGYVVYDLTHYATHHLPMTAPGLRWLKRNHLLHHHATPDDRFGVTSPLWDIVFRTQPKAEQQRGIDLG